MSSYVIVGIHGLNNKPPEDRLKAGWVEAMACCRLRKSAEIWRHRNWRRLDTTTGLKRPVVVLEGSIEFQNGGSSRSVCV